MSEWNLLPHEEATLLSMARDEALLSQEDHDYLPNAPEQADVFHPHEWVLEAIRRAYSMGGMLEQIGRAKRSAARLV